MHEAMMICVNQAAESGVNKDGQISIKPHTNHVFGTTGSIKKMLWPQTNTCKRVLMHMYTHCMLCAW